MIWEKTSRKAWSDEIPDGTSLPEFSAFAGKETSSPAIDHRSVINLFAQRSCLSLLNRWREQAQGDHMMRILFKSE